MAMRHALNNGYTQFIHDLKGGFGGWAGLWIIRLWPACWVMMAETGGVDLDTRFSKTCWITWKATMSSAWRDTNLALAEDPPRSWLDALAWKSCENNGYRKVRF